MLSYEKVRGGYVNIGLHTTLIWSRLWFKWPMSWGVTEWRPMPSHKVAMTSRFLGIVGSLSPSEQTIWIPHHNVQDPITWTLTHLLQLKQEYNNLQNKYNCVVQEWFLSKILQLPLWTLSYCRPSPVFIRSLHTIVSCLIRGNHDRSFHQHNVPYHGRLWRHGSLGLKSSPPPRIQGWLSN